MFTDIYNDSWKESTGVLEIILKVLKLLKVPDSS